MTIWCLTFIRKYLKLYILVYNRESMGWASGSIRCVWIVLGGGVWFEEAERIFEGQFLN